MAHAGRLDLGRFALVLCALTVVAGAFVLGRSLSSAPRSAEPVVRLTPLAAPTVSVQAPPSLRSIGPLPARKHRAKKSTSVVSGGGSVAAPSHSQSSGATHHSGSTPAPPPVGGSGNL